MVSIIIPCYNGEKFIKRCFDSILNQTYKSMEVIIVNDGSIDKSEEIILGYKDIFEENNIILRYVYKQNGGPSTAINEGLKYVRGKYLTLLDIDDYLMKESIELKVKFLNSHIDYDMVRTNGYYVTENNLEDTSNLFVINENEKSNIYIFNDLIEAKTNNWAGSYMVRTEKLFEFYHDKNIYESKYGQNLQILLPIAYRSKSGFIDLPLMKYIRQENSLSKPINNFKKEVENIIGYKEIRLKMIDLIVNEKEKGKYIKLIEVKYARNIMDLAYLKKDKEIMYENCNILKQLNSATLEDRILYYGVKNKFIQYLLRIYRKLFIGR